MAAFAHAFSLSPEEVRSATPPGTVILSVTLAGLLQNAGQAAAQSDELLYTPQPSSDPADPLNWPNWRKSAVLVNVLMLGAANIWWVPLANIFGRRPVILGGILLLTLCSMWAGLAKGFGSLLAARVFMGIGGAPADTTPNVVGEVFFTHERGRAMGFYTVCICLGPIIGGMSGGYIAGNKGLAWIHWVNVILSAILLVACLILVPETRYIRDQTQVSSQNDKSTDVETNGVTEVVEDMAVQPSGPHSKSHANPASMWKLNKYQGDAWSTLLAPWKTFRLPGVWLVMFWYAGLVGGVVTVTTVAPTIISEPPYLWGNNTGLIMTGGIIGALLGLIATSLTADWIITSKKTLRGEVFTEAEARLPVAIPGLLPATTGLWTFGFCAQNSGSPNMWVGMQFGIGMLCFGLIQAPSIGFNYLIDAYGPLSADCFVAVTCMRAIVSFSWTFFAGEWVTISGPAIPFGVFGALMGVFSLLIVPIWFWGKRMRTATTDWV
ncbi:hypothetical protein N7507_002856 [Penicillium longicatenatum]|nr:hypothetical protein N7507_002856 [Penicillium longicatenatum]